MVKNFPFLIMLLVGGIAFMTFLSNTEMVPFLKIVLTLVGLGVIFWGIIGMVLHGWVMGHERRNKQM